MIFFFFFLLKRHIIENGNNKYLAYCVEYIDIHWIPKGFCGNYKNHEMQCVMKILFTMENKCCFDYWYVVFH